MRPVVEEPNNTPITILHTIIILVCVIAIGAAVYFQFFKNEKIGVILGVTKEKQDNSEQLENEFNNIFDNTLEVLDNTSLDVNKEENNEIVYAKFKKEVIQNNKTINVSIPYINISEDVTNKFNVEIQNLFKTKTENVLTATDGAEKVIYSVNYKAYIQNDILSLVIKSELKENDNKQRIIIQTYNYNLRTKKEESLEDILDLKSIDLETANKKIKEVIENKQKKNESLKEAGYNVYTRDYTSSIYYANNVEDYLFGKDGHIYIIYAYGNDDFTSDMDLVVL